MSTPLLSSCEFQMHFLICSFFHLRVYLSLQSPCCYVLMNILMLYMLVVPFCLLGLLPHVVYTYVKYVLHYKYLQLKIFIHSSGNYIFVMNSRKM